MISSYSNGFEFDRDQSNSIFQDYDHPSHNEAFEVAIPVMEIVITFVCVIGAAIILALCCKCVCNNKSRGRVLQPPPDNAPPHPPAPGIYPQQQYSTVTIPTAVVPGHVNVTPFPTSGAPYPTATHYPLGAPYGGAAPYPGGAPYPAVAPYPTNTPYPSAMPQPASAPSAPHEHAFIGVAPPGWHPQALPPSYDQVMSSEGAKHPPFNPYAPH